MSGRGDECFTHRDFAPIARVRLLSCDAGLTKGAADLRRLIPMKQNLAYLVQWGVVVGVFGMVGLG